MSQITKNTTSVSPIPPIVITQFTADDSTIATPSANNINDLTASSVPTNNLRGIQSTNSGSSIFYQLTNRVVVTTTTSDGAGQTQTVTLMTPTNATAINFECVFVAYDAVNDEAGGGDQDGIARKSAGTVTIVGINDNLDQSDPGLVAIDWNVLASGGDLVAQFVGVAGRTLTWTATFTYDQTP